MHPQLLGKAIFKTIRWRAAAALLCALSALHCGQTNEAPATGDASTLQLALSPSNPQIAQGTAVQFAVRGMYSNGHRPDLTQSVLFSVSAADGHLLPAPEAGLVQLELPGRYLVRADFQGRSVSTAITVTAAKLTSLALTPKTPQVPKGLTQAFTATAGFSDGTSQDVTTSATWSAKDLMGSQVVLLSSKGVATAKNIGQASITVRYKTLSASTTMQVTAATLTSLSISPANPTLAVTGSLTFSAQGTFSDGTMQDVTAAADWGVTDVVGSGVASIDGSTVVADSAGQATVSVFYEGLEADTTLTVTGVTLLSLAISPLSPSIIKGTTQQFAATGAYSDGSTRDLTALATWTATDIVPSEGVATISSTGLATGNQTGQSTITASYLGLNASTVLTVAASAGSWVPQTSTATGDLIDIWGSSVNDIWVVEDATPTVWHWNGTTWSSTSVAGASQFQAVWGSDANNVWAAGLGGVIEHWNGTAWTPQTSGTTNQLFGLWGLDANNVWAVGVNGTILKWNGTTWAAQKSPIANNLYRVWGSDANNVWAVGDASAIVKWNGTAWAVQSAVSFDTFTGLWGSDANHVWASGLDGTLMEWNGTAWVSVSISFSGQIVRVWGLDSNDVWAVGISGFIAKWNGTSWVTEASGSTQVLTGIWGTDVNNLWTIGYGGTILRWEP